MAAQAGKPAEEQAPVKKGPGLIVWGLVSAVSAGAGFAVPAVLKSGTSPSATAEPKKSEEQLAAEKKPAFVSFPSVMVNLNEGSLSRFMKLKINLQVNAVDQKLVADAVEEKKLPLQSWLLAHLADKALSEIRGTAGQNMVRREILEKFNSFLFADGHDRIYDVLFEEFNIQ